MRTLKKLLVMSLTALVLFGCGFGKMIPRYPEVTVKLENPDLENKGGKVEYTVKGNVPPKYMKKKAILEVEVPVVAPEGDLQNKVVMNKITLVGEKSKVAGTKIPFKTGGNFTVSSSFDFKEIYEDQNIYALSTGKVGKKEHTFAPIKLGEGISNTASRFGLNPVLSEEQGNGTLLLYGPHNYKQEFITQTAVIYFEVNRSDMNWGLKLNKDQAAKKVIQDFIQFMTVAYDEGRTIDKVVISGWASPEGEESLNQGLSEKRFEQGKKWFNEQLDTYLKNYAKKNKLKLKDVKKPEIKFENHAKGEDWNGFEVAVEKSNIAEKSKILNVVRSQTSSSAREQKIREMTDIYQEIADMILPPLRRAEVAMVCNKNSYNDVQIAELAQTTPSKLSVNERLYAASMLQNLDAKEAIYNAMINDPQVQNDWRAYNSLAILQINKYIQTGDNTKLDEAQKLLDKASAISPGNGIILNNTAILNFLTGDKNTAKANFEKSASATLLPVKQDYNLGVFKIQAGDYAAAKQMMGNRSCDYGMALAQLLQKDYGAAKTSLDCITPKDAKAFYLTAVLAARTNAEQDVYTNLKKAIELNSAYKATAKKDAEFKKYKKNEQFKNIVN